MKKFTIFALDDDEMFCSLLSALAKRDDFIRAVDGHELSLTVFNDMKNIDDAVESIKNTRPDLVLLDYFLLPWGCVGAIEVLKKITPCCAGHTEVIIMTGMYSEDVRFKLVGEAAAKMNMSIIQKPFSISDLKEMIKTIIKKRENV